MKGLGEVLAMAPLTPTQLGIWYRSQACCLSFKVISVENLLTAGHTGSHACAHTHRGDTKMGTHAHTHSHTPYWPSGGGAVRLVCARGLHKQAFNCNREDIITSKMHLSLLFYYFLCSNKNVDAGGGHTCQPNLCDDKWRWISGLKCGQGQRCKFFMSVKVMNWLCNGACVCVRERKLKSRSQ